MTDTIIRSGEVSRQRGGEDGFGEAVERNEDQEDGMTDDALKCPWCGGRMTDAHDVCSEAAEDMAVRLRGIEGAAWALLSRWKEGPREDANIFAEWDTLEDALRGGSLPNAAFIKGARAMLEALSYEDGGCRYNEWREGQDLLIIPEVCAVLGENISPEASPEKG